MHVTRIAARTVGPLIAAGLLAASAASAFAQAAPQQAPPELAQAVRQWVQDQGRDYVGACRSPEAQNGANAGKMCSAIVSLTEDAAEVAIGLVLSDQVTSVTFQRANGRWAPAGSAGPSGAAHAGSTGGSGTAEKPDATNVQSQGPAQDQQGASDAASQTTGGPQQTADGLTQRLRDALPRAGVAGAAAAALAIAAGGLALTRRTA